MVHNSTDQEISEAKRLIEMLRESERKYGLLFENSKDAIYVTRRNGKFVYVNSATADLLGYAREEIIELNVKNLFANPGDRKIFQEMIEKRGSVKDFEVKLCKNDWSEIDCLISAIAITPVNGSIERYQGIISDITDYKRVGKNLKSSPEYTQNIIDSSLDMIIAVDKRRRIIEFNKAAEDTFGYSRGEVLGRHVNLLYADIKEGLEVHKKTVKNRYNVQEVLNRRKNGEVFPSLLSASILVDSGDNRVGVMGISRDITEQINTRQSLEDALVRAKESDRLKTLFLANMSHEVRTPLNTILGFTDLLEQTVGPKITAEEISFFNTIQSSSQRLLRTITEILDISQIEAGTFKLDPIFIHLERIVDEIVKELLPLATEKDLTMEFTSEIPRAIIKIDKYCIRQALANVIDNAIKYTEKGTIEILLTGRGKKFIITVKDTGIGISKEYQDQLFETFTQESMGYTKRFQGVGLGMALTKRFLEINNAAIDIQSSKGLGTTVIMTFMATAFNGKPSIVKEVSLVTKKVNKRKMILLVEDDPASQKLMEFFLCDNYETCFAESVSDAKKRFKEKSID
ncbi:MAG: PAS domain-containing sensor histidine kinase, partial [Thermodesulfobacteriota bacterium]